MRVLQVSSKKANTQNLIHRHSPWSVEEGEQIGVESYEERLGFVALEEN